MRKLLFAATGVSAMALGSTAFAATSCEDGWTALNETYSKANAEGTFQAGIRGDLRDLRRAALMLQNAGYADACESVVEAMKDMADNPEARRNLVNVRAETEQEMAEADREAAEIMRERNIEEEIAKAIPVTEYPGSLSSETLVGADVHNMKGEDLGAIDDVLMNMKEGATHVLVGFGGFLGIGDKDVAVPLKGAKISPDGDRIYIEMSEKQMEAAPDFDYAEYEEDTASWREKNDSVYNN